MLQSIRQDILFEEAPKCGVGKSRICDGQGMFALGYFKRGETVADYSKATADWKKCPWEEIPDTHRAFCWWIGLDSFHCLLASPESLFMRANHSKEPNTEWNPAKRTLTALRKIEPGEEITYDYTKEIAPASIKSRPPEWANPYGG